MLTVQYYRRQGFHSDAAATAARHVNLQVAEVTAGRDMHGHLYVSTRIRAHERSLRRAIYGVGTRPTCGTEAADQPRSKPRFGTGIRHFLNRKSGVSRGTRCERVYVYHKRRTCLYVARDETRKTGPTKWRSTGCSLGSLL